jgi:catechol 2,3-dioxygenase-like lactoylglutathione lyase family enzyme
MKCKHVAIFVSDLRTAEAFYHRVLAMDVLFRESDVGGVWYALPSDKGWDDAEQAGVELAMSALRRDGFVLALFRGSPQPGTVREICFALAGDEIEAIAARLQEEAIVPEREHHWLRFDDPFGFRWTFQEAHVPFRSSGEIADRWLEVGERVTPA